MCTSLRPCDCARAAGPIMLLYTHRRSVLWRPPGVTLHSDVRYANPQTARPLKSRICRALLPRPSESPICMIRERFVRSKAARSEVSKWLVSPAIREAAVATPNSSCDNLADARSAALESCRPERISPLHFISFSLTGCAGWILVRIGRCGPRQRLCPGRALGGDRSSPGPGFGAHPVRYVDTRCGQSYAFRITLEVIGSSTVNSCMSSCIGSLKQ